MSIRGQRDDVSIPAETFVWLRSFSLMKARALQSSRIWQAMCDKSGVYVRIITATVEAQGPLLVMMLVVALQLREKSNDLPIRKALGKNGLGTSPPYIYSCW